MVDNLKKKVLNIFILIYIDILNLNVINLLWEVNSIFTVDRASEKACASF